MKDRPVVEPGLGKGYKVVDVPRRIVGKELDDYPARSGLDHREPVLAVGRMRLLQHGRGGRYRYRYRSQQQHRQGLQRGAPTASK